MNIKEENICRLCLKVAENDYEKIDETVRNMFKILSLRVNFDISKEPIMCKDCKGTSMKCLDFKSVFMVTEEHIRSFATNKNRATFTLKDIFNNGQDIETVDDNFVCRFCLNRLSGSNFVLLDTLINNVTFAEQLQALLPVMYSNIKNPVVCTPCGQDLACYIKFAENCLDVEGKIANYCRDDYTRSRIQIKLSDVLQCSFKNILESENGKIYGIKKEDLGDAHSEVYDGELIKAEEKIDIKENGVGFDESVCQTLSEMPEHKLDTSCELNESEMGEAQKASNPNGSFTPTTNYETGLCSTTRHRAIKRDKVSKLSSVMEIRTAKRKGAVKKKKHSLSTKNALGAIIFKCVLCTYETNRKNNLETHMLIHKHIKEVETYKCSMCTYETKHKSGLRRHTLIHENITKVETLNCSTCSYATKEKSNLKRHMLIHKHVTEVKMYKCSMCEYETIHKGSLKTHMLIHKHVTEVEMYKCATCTYETKHKSGLRRHMLIHKGVTEVEIYKCSMCTYETKQKRILKTHTLTHIEKGTVSTVVFGDYL